jgi:Flp pilus assembly protein TadD
MRGTDFSPKPTDGSGRQSTEQARLDDAMRRADDLLVSSLKTDDRRRARRIRLFFLLGGLAMFLIVCVVALALAIQGQLAAANADSSDQLTREGWQLWSSQQYDEAAAKFAEAVKLAPKNTNAWNGLGWSQFNGGHRDEAVESFKKVIALEPRHPAALNGLGQIAFFQRKYKDAEKYLLKAAPQAPAAWYGLAKLYLLEGKFADARKWAKKLVDSGESDETAKEMLQAAEAKKLDPELRKKIEPIAADDSASNESARGWQLFNKGRNAEAKEAFAKALAANPKNGAALNGMGWALLASGEAAEAKPYFEKILAAEPDAAGALNGLARVTKLEGELDGAIKIWEDMLVRFPDATAVPYELADAYVEKEEFAKAVPLLEKLAKADPTNQQLQAKLARAREHAGAVGKPQ